MTKLITVVFLVSGLTFLSCASPPGKTKEPATADAGKPQAAVEVAATLGASTAKLDVKFQGSAKSVTIKVTGVDGLRVTAPSTPVTFEQVQAGQVIVLDVNYEVPEGESNLAVFLTGEFGGTRASKAVSFTVGSRTVGQAQKAQQGVQTDSQGERVRTVPMDSK